MCNTIIVDEIDLNNAMVDQIIGNANGGGIHDGVFRLKFGSSFDMVGRLLSSGEKTLERTAMKKNPVVV